MNNLQEILLKAPFLSKFDKKNKKYPYLGTGYYLWESNVDLAKWWGRVHYKNNYVIVQMDMYIYLNELLDLVGNASQIKQFSELYFYFKAQVQAGLANELTISEFIELLKQRELFEHKIIKAIDIRPLDKKYTIKFTPNQKTLLNLQPRIFYCFIENSDRYFKNKKIVSNG